MNSFEVYQKYLALKLHFSSPSYDYFKYAGKVAVKRETFQARNDKYYFDKLRNKYKEEEIESFLVANLMKEPNTWVGRLLEQQAHDRFLDYQKRQQSMSYLFEQELEVVKCAITESFDALFRCKGNEHPKLLRMVLVKDISVETLIIMNEVLNFFPHWNKNITENYVWPRLRQRCERYKSFFAKNLDKDKYRSIMRKAFYEEATKSQGN
jgi:hypothetical protein